VAVTVYATVADFTARLPVTAWGARTVSDVETALADASGLMDDYFRGRFTLPFVSVGRSVSVQCVNIARNLFMGGRGFSPPAGADQDIIDALKWAEDWLDRVQRRVLFPDVVLIATPTALDQPFVISSSVINDNGVRGPNRGW
jgi:phage gp36-like protein